MTETFMGIRIPQAGTLLKYGMGTVSPWIELGLDAPVEDWKRMLVNQGGGCGVCGRVAEELPIPKRGDCPYLNIDHEHVRGWKMLMPAERRMYVRGLCCTRCNHYVLTRFATPFLHRAAADYLERHMAEKERA